MRPIKAGDYFLLPFTGSRLERLVRAVRPYGGDQWYCTSAKSGAESMIALRSCHRCAPSTAARILATVESGEPT